MFISDCCVHFLLIPDITHTQLLHKPLKFIFCPQRRIAVVRCRFEDNKVRFNNNVQQQLRYIAHHVQWLPETTWHAWIKRLSFDSLQGDGNTLHECIRNSSWSSSNSSYHGWIAALGKKKQTTLRLQFAFWSLASRPPFNCTTSCEFTTCIGSAIWLSLAIYVQSCITCCHIDMLRVCVWGIYRG